MLKQLINVFAKKNPKSNYKVKEYGTGQIAEVVGRHPTWDNHWVVVITKDHVSSAHIWDERNFIVI